jgi:two-component system chemotaxis sensor kinase CheA
MLDKFKDAFREEASELLIQLEETLLELEEHPDDLELINTAFRAIHTIKGSSGMFGFDSIASFAHDFEDLLDECRSGRRSIGKQLIDFTLAAKDHLRNLLDLDGVVDEEAEVRGKGLLERLSGLKTEEGFPTEKTDAEARVEAEGPEPQGALLADVPAIQAEAATVLLGDDEASGSWRIYFKPKGDIFHNGTKLMGLLRDVGKLGTMTAFPHMHEVPSLPSLDPETCYVSWDLFLTTDRGLNAVKDAFIFVEDASELRFERVSESELSGMKSRKLGQILIDRGLVTDDAIRDALKTQRRLGEVLLERKVVTPGQIASALSEQEHFKRVQERPVDQAAASIRVASDKLDALVDLVGELVTLQARLTQTTLDSEDAQLSAIAEQFDRLIGQLRDNTMSIRMMPIGSSFNRFKRVVRDLSAELGKEVVFATRGEETELDKTVIEKLADPLVHLIRNSLDHGIERPDARAAAGKKRFGTITLSAKHSGAYVLIQVSDDGKGLDTEAIRRRAVERGLIAANQELSEHDVHELILLPGFSTADKVTTVSGRGVGMDVVKREIDSLGGSIELRSSPGQGSTISLKIPLTLAIIEGLLIKTADAHFVVPLAAVDGCVEVVHGSGESEGEIIRYRDEFVPVLDLRQTFEIEGERPTIEQIVIANAQDSRVGILVDSVVGNNQTVIKPLGKVYRNVDGLSGATILGDGTVALILDVNKLASSVAIDKARAAGKRE